MKIQQEARHLGFSQAQSAPTGVWNSSVFCPLMNTEYLHVQITWGAFKRPDAQTAPQANPIKISGVAPGHHYSFKPAPVILMCILGGEH